MGSGLENPNIHYKKLYHQSEEKYNNLKKDYDDFLQRLADVGECYEVKYIREIQIRDKKIEDLETCIDELNRKIFGLEKTVSNWKAREYFRYKNL